MTRTCRALGYNPFIYTAKFPFSFFSLVNVQAYNNIQTPRTTQTTDITVTRGDKVHTVSNNLCSFFSFLCDFQSFAYFCT